MAHPRWAFEGPPRSGQSLILVLLLLPVLLGMAAASLTVGAVYLARTTLQNAVDAAALAGGQALAAGDTQAPGDQARVIQINDPKAHGTVVVNPNPKMPGTVLAQASQQVPPFFAALFGYKSFTVTAVAVAATGPGPDFQYAIFSGSHQTALSITGGQDYVKGSIHTNNSLRLSGGGYHITGNLNTVGGAYSGQRSVSSTSGPCTSATTHSCYGSVTTNAPSMPMEVWNNPPMTPTNANTLFANRSDNGEYLDVESGGDVDQELHYTTSSGGVGVSQGPHGPILTGNYIVHGNFILSGGNWTINGSVEVVGGSFLCTGGNLVANGNLTASGGSIVITGGNNTVNGYVVAEGGNVVIHGGGSTNQGAQTPTTTIAAFPAPGVGGKGSNPSSGSTPSNPQGGNIVVTGGGNPLYGVIYSPDGQIYLPGGNDVIQGSVVGRWIRMPGGSDQVIWNQKVVDSFPGSHTYLVQ